VALWIDKVQQVQTISTPGTDVEGLLLLVDEGGRYHILTQRIAYANFPALHPGLGHTFKVFPYPIGLYEVRAENFQPLQM